MLVPLPGALSPQVSARLTPLCPLCPSAHGCLFSTGNFHSSRVNVPRTAPTHLFTASCALGVVSQRLAHSRCSVNTCSSDGWSPVPREGGTGGLRSRRKGACPSSPAQPPGAGCAAEAWTLSSGSQKAPGARRGPALEEWPPGDVPPPDPGPVMPTFGRDPDRHIRGHTQLVCRPTHAPHRSRSWLPSPALCGEGTARSVHMTDTSASLEKRGRGLPIPG